MLNNFAAVDPHIECRFVNPRVCTLGAPTAFGTVLDCLKHDLHLVLHPKMSEKCLFSGEFMLNNFAAVDPHIDSLYSFVNVQNDMYCWELQRCLALRKW